MNFIVWPTYYLNVGLIWIQTDVFTPRQNFAGGVLLLVQYVRPFVRGHHIFWSFDSIVVKFDIGVRYVVRMRPI